MEAYSPSGYRLMVRCKGSGDLSGMSSRENKEIGSEEFLLAVKDQTPVDSYNPVGTNSPG